MNDKRHSVAVAVLHGKIFAVGGNDSGHYLSSVESYDPETNVWSPEADLPVSRGETGLGEVDEILYSVGDNGIFSYTNAANTSTWSQVTVADMNHSRTCPGVVTHAGHLYVVGGY